MDGQDADGRLPPLAWVAAILILAGSGLVFVAGIAPGAQSFAQTHGELGCWIGFAAAVLWLSETKPAWLYFGVTFGVASAVIDPAHWLLGIAGLLCLALARALQVKLHR